MYNILHFYNEIYSCHRISMQLLQCGNAELSDVISNQDCYICINAKGEQKCLKIFTEQWLSHGPDQQQHTWL